MAQEHESAQNCRRLVEDVSPAAKSDDYRVGPASGDGDRNQDHHVEGSCSQGAHRSVEEDPARIPDHGQAEDQLEDVIPDSERSGDLEMQDLAANRRPEQDRHR